MLNTNMPKRKVFVSYHHGSDQQYYDYLTKTFADQYDVFSDNSLERAFQSDDTDYVRWAIKQNHIKGSSCTVVLVGPNTWGRKYVDWEIKATLEEKHGLICILLPTTPRGTNGGTNKPKRLQDNLDSNYAKFLEWQNLNAQTLQATIQAAVLSQASLIDNSEPMRQKNA